MIADGINGTFELLGGAFIWLCVWQILRDKQSKGVNPISIMFFAVWGFWNLYYYPSLGQWWSLVGGVSVVVANVTWVLLMIKYREKK